LFGYINQAEIRNVVLTGPLMSITGADATGSLVGISYSSQVSNSMNTGSVQGSNYTGGLGGVLFGGQLSNSWNTGSVEGVYRIGGLVGEIEDSQIRNSWNIGSVQGDSGIGGLVGELSSSQIINSWNAGSVEGADIIGGLVGELYYGQVSNSLSTGLVTGTTYVGGLIGGEYSIVAGAIRNSYWAIDSSSQTISNGESEANSYVGVTLATLQCAIDANTHADNSNCVSNDGSTEGLNAAMTLFNEWDKAVDNGQALWDFGTATQLPALVLNGTVYRDSDGDGLLNSQDAYPLISLGDLLDSDGDGIPNECNTDCVTLGMTADSDDDNDGVLDTNDAFPFIPIGELLDTDNDGAPDTCNADCLALNMSADLDDDNDGVLDVNDPHQGNDNGAPELLSVASTTSFAVTSDNGFTYDLLVDENFFMDFSAIDARDTTFTYEASLNGSPLSADENDIMLIPAGRNEIQWTAIDASGNRSEPVEQIINVYPQVRFDKSTSIIGEASFTEIKVRLTGDSPSYPVVVTFEINDTSDADQDDLSVDFDITTQHQVIIESGDTESLNREAFINIPIIEDNESENDERLILDLVSAKLQSESDDDIESLFTVNEDNQQHELTITYQNLAPTVQFKLEQNGLEVANVQQDGGMVTLTAVVQDGNGNDVHSFIWDIDSLGLNAPLGSRISFDPINLAEGTYDISVTATDNGIGQLSDDALLSLEIIAPVQESRDGESTGSGGSGGGSINWWFMIVILGLISGLRAKRRELVNY